MCIRDRYEPSFVEDTVNNVFTLAFRNSVDQSYLNDLGFSLLPVEVGDYPVHDTRELFLGAKASFSQIVNNEFDGWVYEPVKLDEGYFNITSLNKEDQHLEGKFKAHFELESRNGFQNTGLPKSIKFEGVFHDAYIRD